MCSLIAQHLNLNLNVGRGVSEYFLPLLRRSNPKVKFELSGNDGQADRAEIVTGIFMIIFS